jgi:hypothetical protein
MTGGVIMSLMMSHPNSIVAREIVTTIITIRVVIIILSNFFKNVSIGLSFKMFHLELLTL